MLKSVLNNPEYAYTFAIRNRILATGVSFPRVQLENLFCSCLLSFSNFYFLTHYKYLRCQILSTNSTTHPRIIIKELKKIVTVIKSGENMVNFVTLSMKTFKLDQSRFNPL